MTTIKVDSSVRDRLAGVASARRVSMGELLATVADRLEAEQEWMEIEEAYARLKREDPTAWQEYLRELTEWEAISEPDTTAATEWPEFNQ